ncbi:MAG: FKBP-type peptidyl-prolyl cis-trans isomerase [Flavobacteriales bacterium]
MRAKKVFTLFLLATFLVSCGNKEGNKEKGERDMKPTNKQTKGNNKNPRKNKKSKAQMNLEQGKVFLKKNKKKEGVKTTESGLQYKILKKGDGKSPSSPKSTVKVHYTGMFINRKIFDSSIERGKPAEFPLNRVIDGWTEGLQMMKEGGKWKFFIPYDLAYGKRGKPPKIGPNKTLIFEIELLEVME